MLHHGTNQIAEAQTDQDQDCQHGQATYVLHRTLDDWKRRNTGNVARRRSAGRLSAYKSYNRIDDKFGRAAYRDAGNRVDKPMRHLFVALAMIVGAVAFTFTAASALQTAAAVHSDSALMR